MASPPRRTLEPGKQIRRALVIHTAFLGDIVLATPFLSALRKVLPEAEIRFLTTPGGAALLSPNPWGIVPLAFDKRGREAGLAGFWRKSRELKSFAPELVFCLHRSLRSTLLARAAGGESWGFREGAASFLFHGKVGREGRAYEGQKNLALLEEWSGRRDFEPWPKLLFSAADAEDAARLLGGGDGPFAVLAPSSVWATKRWPGEKFGELALRLWREKGLRSVIVGGTAAEDGVAAAETLAAFRAGARAGEPEPRNLSGSTGLGGLKSVLSRAKVVVSNDSSPLHMAVALGVRAVGVFGPTTREIGFFPLAPPGMAAVAEISLACRPCGLHGHDRCPLGHFRCMRDLRVEQVFAEVEKVLCP